MPAHQPLYFNEIDDINLCDLNQLTNTNIGDLYVRTATGSSDSLVFYQGYTATADVLAKINGRLISNTPFRPTGSIIVYARDMNDSVEMNFTIGNRVLHHIINNNQVSLLVQVNSGTPVQLAGNTDLNGDGTNNDRPLFITRNSLNLPTRKNMDLRFSRFFNLHKSYRFEVQAEFKNIFNNEQVSGVQTTYPVNATTGAATGTLPNNSFALIPTGGFEQRKFQLGFKLFF